MIAAICFDFDGTLARFEGNFDALLDSLRAELMLTQCDMTTFAGELGSQLGRDGAVTLHDALLATLTRLEVRPPPELAAVARQAVADYAAQVRLLPGALELLTYCAARVPLALISNGPRDMQRAAVERLGVATYFKTVLISGDNEVAARKPDPRIFRLACERLGVAPEQALMVGDNRSADIEGALACGMQAVHLSPDSQDEPSPQTYRWVGSLLELKETLDALLKPA